MTAAPLVVVGDALLDRDLDGRVERLAPDAPVPVVEDPVQHSRPGGAGLAAALAAADGRPVTLITALARDLAGRELGALLAEAGVEVLDLGLEGRTPEKVRVTTHGRSLLRIDRGGRRGEIARAPAAAVTTVLEDARAVLVSDYGRGVAADPAVRMALEAAVAAGTPVIWDPHPRGPEPVRGVALATPNRAEAARAAGAAVPAEQAGELVERWGADHVCVTLGADGAALAGRDGDRLQVPAPRASGGDPCGAGDRFASVVAARMADGAAPAEAVTAAVAKASAFVAAGGAAAARLNRPEPLDPRGRTGGGPDELVRRARESGWSVVATGGCFDLLHAGHVRTLQGARALGDCLVVCLNSDDSVRRLKGPDRPVVSQEDRAAVLSALACVDAVAVFDEDTPEAVLDRLRPDVWAKGGDYSVDDLPEARLMERWSGRAVILPYVEGRSTTRLIREAAHRGV